ncbi:hypothetical protein R0J87_08095 [Halomonas sp. SIMBA_159]
MVINKQEVMGVTAFDPKRPSAEIEYSQEPLARNARFSGGGYNTSAHMPGKACCKLFKTMVYEKALYAYAPF